MKEGKSKLITKMIVFIFVCLSFAGIAFGAGPANDTFSNAQVIVPGHTKVRGSNFQAATLAGERGVPGTTAGRTIWYRWTAPGNGLLKIGASGTGQQVAVAVYSGTGAESLQYEGGNLRGIANVDSYREFIWWPASEFRMPVHSGSSYWIVADTLEVKKLAIPWTGWWTDEGYVNFPLYPEAPVSVPSIIPEPPFNIPGGPIELALSFVPAPQNDLFAHPLVLTGQTNVVNASNFAAVDEPEEMTFPDHSGGSTVWYSWTAPVSTEVTVNLSLAQAAQLPVPNVPSSGADTGGADFDLSPYTLMMYIPPPFTPVLTAYSGDALNSLSVLGRGRRVRFKAVAGRTYRICFDGIDKVYGGIVFSVAQPSPPTNDNFENALTVPFVNGATTNSNRDATRQAGEAALPGTPVGRTIWYRWTAPGDGCLKVTLPPVNQNVVAAAYTGKTVADLQLIASNSYRMAHRYHLEDFVRLTRREFNLPVYAGTEYLIAADTSNEDAARRLAFGYSPNPPEYEYFKDPFTGEDRYEELYYAGTDIALQFDFTPAPANDRFASPITVVGLTNFVRGTNYGAVMEQGEKVYPDSPGGSSVWYQWTAPVAGQTTIGLDGPVIYPPPSFQVLAPAVNPGSVYGIVIWDGTGPGGSDYAVDLDARDFAPILSVYAGDTLTSLRLMGRGSNVTFQAESGRTYRISFEGLQMTYGEVTFYVTQTPPPSNDRFADALAIIDASIAVFSGHVVSATREPGEPASSFSGGGSVWYRWKAPSYGTVLIRQTRGSFPVSVYSGTSLGNLHLDAETAGGALTLFASAGTEYFIAISAGSQTPDSFSLKLEAPQLRFAELSTVPLQVVDTALRVPNLAGKTALIVHRSGDRRIIVGTTFIKNYLAVFDLARPAFRDLAQYLQSLPLLETGPFELVTIDEELPVPQVRPVKHAAELTLELTGFAGQRCWISTSDDLARWSPPEEYHLEGDNVSLERINASLPAKKFFKVLPGAP